MTNPIGTTRRKSLRLPQYDYSQGGAYFVTICAQGRKCLFGSVIGGEMQLNDHSKLVTTCWHNLSFHYPAIILDAFVVMPNHMHGIIILVGAGSPRPNAATVARTVEGGETPPLQKYPTLGQIVGYFKFQSSKRINELREMVRAPVWQRGYYEHVIRDDQSLNRIREYIATNPQRWHLDRENPQAQGKDGFDGWLASFKVSPTKKYKSGRGDPAPTEAKR